MNSNRSDIFRLKLQIENCPHIGHGTRALGQRVCSYIYNHPQLRFAVDDAFPLPWTLCSRLLWGASRRQCYRMLQELVCFGHFGCDGARGCPATVYFHLIIPDTKYDRPAVASSAKNGTTRDAKNGTARCDTHGTTGSAKKGTPRFAKNGTSLIYSSLREEIVSSNGINGGLSPDKKRGGN